jgi:hypothetical protein
MESSMKKRHVAAVTALCCSLLAGCAFTQVGEFRVHKAVWEQDVKDVTSRASFELNCPPQSLSLVILTTRAFDAKRVIPSSIGVSGCDRRLVYVRSYPAGWVLNSDSKQNQSSAPR